MNVLEMMDSLKTENINTWFDLGLFIDRIKETRKTPSAEYSGSFDEFKKTVAEGGIAFVTYAYSVDGATVETEKYAKTFRKFLKDVPIHFVGGDILPESDRFIDPSFHKFELKEIRGFNRWKLYNDFFYKKLERGSKTYNKLILQYWKEVLIVTEKLGLYIEKNHINLLFPVNVFSNPGNLSLTLALVLISEYLGIPVINNNHDFYWEGGNRKIDIVNKGLQTGPRDFFFKNSDIGEFFSQIETLFPWDSRSWVAANINKNQSDHLIKVNGFNPANVCEINTAIDTEKFTSISKRNKINAFLQVAAILSGYKKNLVVSAPKEVIKNSINSEIASEPVLIGAKKTILSDLANNNILFLQPTRVMHRKKIEVGFKLIKKLFNNKDFTNIFKKNPQLTFTLLVSGPIPVGQHKYFIKLVGKFSELLKSLNPTFKERVFLGFLFSEIDKKRFKNRFDKPVGIPDLYNIASLIMLPSETEGRGLPIIEATACGVPIFCRRYYPENVYAEVIGEHLEIENRLKVIEFSGSAITDEMVDRIIDRVLFPQSYISEDKHNRRIIKGRYSIEALQTNLSDIFYRLYIQLKPNDSNLKYANSLLGKYKKITTFSNENLRYILKTENRQYLPGFGCVGFMLYLKSLIDPSFFRVEEQQIRGMAMSFAKELIERETNIKWIKEEKLNQFYNVVESLFLCRKGKVKIRHDHSFSYRHRNRNYYPYRDFTHQELFGLISMLFDEIGFPLTEPVFERSPHFLADWNLALLQLTNSSGLEIDDRARLMGMLKTNIPIAYFPGQYIRYELDYFITQPIRARLNLKIEETMTEKHLEEHAASIEPVYIFCKEKYYRNGLTADTLKSYIEDSDDIELRLLYKYGICKVIKTTQWCPGIHFPQLGNEALEMLRTVKKKGGFIIASGENASIMTDIVDIDRIHIGKVETVLASKIMGIALNSGFIQFVPAGLRISLAYPTPVQTAKDFDEAIKSSLYKSLSEKHGEKKLLNIIKKDAETKSSPINSLLKKIAAEDDNKVKIAPVTYSSVSGLYKDGFPWTGIIAKANISKSSKKWTFAAFIAKRKTKKVTAFVDEINKKYNVKARIAWNGGYVLNPELVGKLGLPETYIGSPLGLIISNKKIISPPLFNKPALLIYSNGRLDIKRVNCKEGIIISDKKHKIEFNSEDYNPASLTGRPCYYDLMYDGAIKCAGNVILRLAGNTIKEVIPAGKKQEINILPVGLTLVIPKHLLPHEWNVAGKRVQIKLKGWETEGIEHAVEAGPLLLNNGKKSIDMEIEGWKALNSINTQAARLDFTDMRGPKIAVGMDKNNDLSVLTINGRIRESVGATHDDMAEILSDLGIKKAVGFDPGGSSTLVVDGRELNISPYNSEYESDIYSLPPEPRAVGTAVIGWQN